MRRRSKHGAPRKTAAKAHRNTTTADLAKKPPHPLDNASFSELLELVAEPSAEIDTMIFTHCVPRPGDSHRNRYERMAMINVHTKTTRHFKRRIGETKWSYEGTSAAQPTE
jgi:hypothetical protein